MPALPKELRRQRSDVRRFTIHDSPITCILILITNHYSLITISFFTASRSDSAKAPVWFAETGPKSLDSTGSAPWACHAGSPVHPPQ